MRTSESATTVSRPQAANAAAEGKPVDPRNGLRMFVFLDMFVRLAVWLIAFVSATATINALHGWPQVAMTADLGSAWAWGRRLVDWIVLFNLFYVAVLVLFRLPIPTPREGEYPIGTGQKFDVQVIWSCLVGVLTKARLEAPFPGFLVFHISNLPPMCWLMNAIFGPRSKSCPGAEVYVLDPHLVTIGRNVVLGINAILAGHHVGRESIVYKKTIIEDDVVIGGGVRLLSGVHVKRGAMIAAGSVVLPDTVIGENEYWWGVPARKFRTLTPLGHPKEGSPTA